MNQLSFRPEWKFTSSWVILCSYNCQHSSKKHLFNFSIHKPQCYSQSKPYHNIMRQKFKSAECFISSWELLLLGPSASLLEETDWYSTGCWELPFSTFHVIEGVVSLMLLHQCGSELSIVCKQHCLISSTLICSELWQNWLVCLVFCVLNFRWDLLEVVHFKEQTSKETDITTNCALLPLTVAVPGRRACPRSRDRHLCGALSTAVCVGRRCVMKVLAQ